MQGCSGDGPLCHSRVWVGLQHPDDLGDGAGGQLPLELGGPLDEGGGKGAGLSLVLPGFGLECLESSLAVASQPGLEGGNRQTHLLPARSLPFLVGQALQDAGLLASGEFPLQQFGYAAVAEQRHFHPAVLVVHLLIPPGSERTTGGRG